MELKVNILDSDGNAGFAILHQRVPYTLLMKSKLIEVVWTDNLLIIKSDNYSPYVCTVDDSEELFVRLEGKKMYNRRKFKF